MQDTTGRWCNGVTHLDEHLLQLLASVIDKKLFEAVAPEGLKTEDVDQRDRSGCFLVLSAADN